MSLAAGSLNRQIRIQEKIDGHDAAGQPTKVWADFLSTWANVRGQTGVGTIVGAQGDIASAVTQYSFRIRYRQGLDAGMRVLLDGAPYDITSVQMDEDRREWTDLVCNRGANDG